jgi:hypothetical protein
MLEAEKLITAEGELQNTVGSYNVPDIDDVIELCADSEDEYFTDDSSDEPTNAGYGNFKILDKEDKLIGLCDVKRFRWYIRKGIADQIDEKTVKIKFDPKYKKGAVMNLVERETVCVVCGDNEKLTKFHVVPLQFKRHFPVDKKEHNSTDVILLCKPCSVKANRVTDLFKRDIFDALKVSQRDFIDQDKVDIRKYAIKIIKNKRFGKRYDSELRHIKHLLKLGEKDPEPTDEELDKYSNLNANKWYKGFENIGAYVTDAFKKKAKLDAFASKWKDNFVSNLEPTNLPSDFYLNYNNVHVKPDGSTDDDKVVLRTEETPSS